MTKEAFISVDIETDGPIPVDYSMLSLGAVEMETEKTFYIELKPISQNVVQESLEVTGLDRYKLIKSGINPEDAMKRFAVWITEVAGGRQPVFVASASFDWMFVHWYFVHFLGSNPFGINGVDYKSYYMGMMRLDNWGKAKRKYIDPRFIPDPKDFPKTHNALDDAKQQAEIFRRMRKHFR